jgi:uncharacterized membrane protein HdeD (DUF308 family)
VLTGVIGVVVGATLLTDLAKHQRWLAVVLGVLGILAGVLQAIEKALGAQSKADKHKEASAAWVNMRSKYYLFADTQTDASTAVATLEKLEGEHERLETSSIATEAWTQKTIDRERTGRR